MEGQRGLHLSAEHSAFHVKPVPGPLCVLCRETQGLTPVGGGVVSVAVFVFLVQAADRNVLLTRILPVRELFIQLLKS